MCDTILAFGQRGNHFFQSPSQWDYTRLPKKLTSLLTSAQLHEVHHLALGFEDSFLLTWRDKKGYDYIESRGLPTELDDFLYATNSQGRLIRNIPAIRLTLGPYNTSFFVHDTSAYIWKNIPPLLSSALQARIKNGSWIDHPRIVALGSDSNFLLITEKHAAVWDLSYYDTLLSMLEYSRTQARGIADVSNVVLHPYRYQCFIAQSRNGTLITGNIPPHEAAGVQSMRVVIMKDTTEAERRAKEVKKRIENVPRRQTSHQYATPMRASIEQHAALRRDLGERRQEFRAQSKGLKLSLSLSIRAGGLTGNISRLLR